MVINGWLMNDYWWLIMINGDYCMINELLSMINDDWWWLVNDYWWLIMITAWLVNDYRWWMMIDGDWWMIIDD